MAKASDKTVSTLEAEKAGGKLSGLLADEKEFDRRALWRIGWWGTAAAGTLIVAMLVNQGAQSWRQDRISAADLARQAQLLQSLARDSQNQSRQLVAAIETLNSDRDRLYARVTVLEQSLDSVTGAFTKTGSPHGSVLSAPASPPSTALATADEQQGTIATPPLSGSQAPAGTAAGASGLSAADSSVVAPTLTPIATTSAPGSDKTRADAGKSGGTPTTTLQPPSSAAMSAMAAAPVGPISSTGATSASLVAPKSIMAPPDSPAARLSEPDKVAKLETKGDSKTQNASAGEAGANPADTVSEVVHKTEFAVDLGSANSISGLRALWRGLLKTNGDLAKLRPIIMVKEGNSGLGMQLRLAAGPLNDAAAAAKICARLSESQRPCETTVYDGQRLATRGTDDNEAGPGTAKQPEASEQKPANTPGTAPTYQRRRGSYQSRHGAAREPQAAQPAAAPAPPQPEPKSEPATLSSLFRRP